MNYKRLILALTALAFFFSCNVREEYVPLASRVSFQAVMADNSSSKTVLQGDGSVYWSPMDSISLFYGELGVQLIADNTEPVATATFSGALDGFLPDGTSEFWAVYPYDYKNTFDGQAVTLVLPDRQAAQAGTYAPGLFPSMARSTDYTLQFYNLCGGVKFSVASEGIESVIFKGNNGEILAGQVQAAFDAEGKPLVTEVVKGVAELQLDAPEGGFEVGKWYYIVSLPVTLSAGYTMTFLSNNEVVAERTITNSITIKRSIWGRLTEADNVPLSVSNFLTFTSEGTTKVSLTTSGNRVPVLYYSYDANTWTQWDFSEIEFTVNTPLYIYGDNPKGFNSRSYQHLFSASGDLFSISGDIMSLLDCNSDLMDIPCEGCFFHLFRDCNLLTHAPSLPATTLTAFCYGGLFYGCSSLLDAPSLPATTLAEGCYSYLFNGCSSLSEAPELPATIAAQQCYQNMFQACTSLTSAPSLPAIQLAYGCYADMFSGCTGLTEAPELPATTLDSCCYQYMFSGCSGLTKAPVLLAHTLSGNSYWGMFNGCTKLNYIKCLATDISANNCLYAWASNVASSGTFVKNARMNDWVTGFGGIPYGWTIEDAEEEPVTVTRYLTFSSEGTTVLSLSNYGDNAPHLYWSTDKQNWAKWDYSELAFTSGAPLYLCGDNPDGFSYSMNQYSQFVTSGDKFDVSGDIFALLDYLDDLSIIPSTSCFYSLFRDCTQLTVAPILSSTTMKDDCYREMFSGCIQLTAAPALPAKMVAAGCYRGMFKGCMLLSEAPELPSQILASQCYQEMFSGCGNINYVKCLATDINFDDCLANWLEGVAAEGTFVKASSMNDWPSGADGIPTGWSVNSDAAIDITASKYLTFTSEGTTTLSLSKNTYQTTVFYYSYDRVNWLPWNHDEQYAFSTGAPLYICGDNPSGINMSTGILGDNYFSASGDLFAVSGDIMSLLDRNNDLFTVPIMCFCNLFNNCNLLTSAPSLPATTLGSYCYSFMFSKCSQLKEAPELPATTLARNCYYGMFSDCTSLVTAPDLPADKLADDCYCQMFYKCSKLSSILCLATDISADNCTGNWLYGVALSGTFVKSPQMSDWPAGENGIPAGWEVVDAQ